MQWASFLCFDFHFFRRSRYNRTWACNIGLRSFDGQSRPHSTPYLLMGFSKVDSVQFPRFLHSAVAASHPLSHCSVLKFKFFCLILGYWFLRWAFPEVFTRYFSLFSIFNETVTQSVRCCNFFLSSTVSLG